jgi:proteasome lid subunit RPN8/RPN11
MIANPAESELATWTAPECPLRIEYAPAVLERIRMAVTDAFFSVPHGGLEIGGVLFGDRQEGGIRILAARPLDCEHSSGPSFVLSAADCERLEALISSPASDRRLRGMEPLGWYHSHTRSEIFLSDADLAVHNRFFPDPWQVALVVRPHVARPARAGFFFRQQDGSIQAGASCAEFNLHPAALPPDEDTPALEPAAPVPVARQVPVRTVTAFAPHLPAVTTRRWPWAKVAAGLAVAALAFGGSTLYRAKEVWAARSAVAAPETISLRSRDHDGTLEVLWDGTAAPVRRARNARLEIGGGGARVAVHLDAAHLRQGSFVFTRQSERVDLRMILHQPDGSGFEERTTFLGPAPVRHPTPEEAEANRQRDLLAREAARMRSQLRAQSERARRLERAVESLHNQLEQERAARPSEAVSGN